MATYYSTEEAKVRASSSLASALDRSGLQLVRRTAVFHYTPTAAEVTTEWLVLGALGIDDARIVPSATIIRFTGTGTIDAKFTLKKLSTAGADGDQCGNRRVAALTAPAPDGASAAGDLVVPDQTDS
jgi:hypothetical protein